MYIIKRIRPISQNRGLRNTRSKGCRHSLRDLNLLISRFVTVRFLPVLALLLLAVASASAQSLFNINSATYGTAASIPAGINGVTLELGGTLPTLAQESSPGYMACFYTPSGSSTAFALLPPDSATTEPLAVPASAIQSIPQSQFTATNQYTVTASIYFVANGAACDGTVDSALTNQFQVNVVAPSLGAYAGPVSIPQTNSVTNIQATPATLTLPASGFVPLGSTLGSTTITFGSFGSVPPATSLSALSVPVPAAFASSPAGTTASLQICNKFGTNTVCTTPDPAITITVAAQVASAGTITATPNPVSVTGTTVLTAQFQKAAGSTANPGAPAGAVTFTADGATVPAAPLILDTTATFAQAQVTTIAPANAPTPTFTPTAGSYTSIQTITIADANPNAAIYYTEDGSTPTTSSTSYTAPFPIYNPETIKAIAAVPGSNNSAVASAAYVVTLPPPTHLAFLVQPVNTPLNGPITPAVQVELLDATNHIAQGSNFAVTVVLQTNPGQSTLAGTTTVNAVHGIATFTDLSLNHVATGYVLAASSGTLTGPASSAFNIIPPPITMTLQSTVPPGLVGEGATLNGSFTLGVAAPAGGLVVNLSSGTPANVTIAPATVTVPAGQTTGAFTYTGGTTAGSSTLSASATGYQTGTAVATSTNAQVSLTLMGPVGPGQTESLALSLGTAAPPGGTTVTFTTANTNIATVTSSIFVPAGQFTAATNPQIAGVLIGTTTVTANAPGYAPATLPVHVTVTASFNPGTTNLNLITSTNTALVISAPAPAGGITFHLTSSDTTKATVPSSITIVQGGTEVKIPITGVADGMVTIAATSTGITEADGTVTVNSTIISPNATTGYDVETAQGYSLPVNPSVPTNVTFKISDPSIAVISQSQTAVGQQTSVFPNVTSAGIGSLYIQGKTVGTTTLTISAPGYTTGTETITVSRTGFAYYYGNQNFTTTTYAAPNAVTIYPFLLDANQSITGYQVAISPGTPALSIPVTSSDTSIGTVTSPVVFNPLDSSKSFNFTPVAAGTANLTLGAQPAGFTEPMQNSMPQYQTAVATVNTPTISAPNVTTGVHLQTGGVGIGLPVAPPSGITVTVTIAPAMVGTPLAATITKTNTVVGVTTLTFTNVTTASVGTIFVQGQSAGTATITVSAPGYTTGTGTVTVQPSGFAYYAGNYNSQTINTTSFSDTTTLYVYPFLLDGNNAEASYPSYTLSPGVGPVTVSISDSNTAVGTISANSLVFTSADQQNYQQFTFQPVSAGTANITLGSAAGFTTPSNYQQVVATVTAPAISVGNQTTGVHLQNSLGISLPVAPPSGRSVTVTSSAPGVLLLSKDNVTPGTASVTFANVTTSYVGQIYLQGQSAGTATLTETANGYTPGTSSVTVYHSGFGFFPGNGTFSTTTFSPANTLTVESLLLDANNDYAGNSLPLSPGVGPVTVSIADSNTSVGTISSNALVFNTNDGYHNFTFQPVAAGTANLTITQPAGFTSPKATSSAGVATVTAPNVLVGDSVTGINLQQSIPISSTLR